MNRILTASAIAVLGLMAAACADNDGPRRVVYVAGAPGWDGHVQWCLDHHPGYDPRSNQFIGRDGYPHVCR
jgi:hypothetical protein